MKEMYFTITGCNHYFGNDFMKKGMKVKLEKEPDNDYDKEAIIVNIKGMGKCGYVANSSFTVKGESMSAGRLYDMDVGIMVMITRMDVNLVEIKAVDQCNNTERVINTREVP